MMMEPSPARRIARTAHVLMKIDRIAAGAAALCDYCPAPGIVMETLRLAGRQERGPLNGDAVAIVYGYRIL
jgi:hypothetical protein